MDNKRRDFQKNKGKRSKTPYERRKTHEEVQKIKEELISYAKTPWGREWIKSVLKTGRPFRMQRGIDYANDQERIDNVLVKKGEIFATVQGTAPTPYRVRVNFELFSREDWKATIGFLRTKLRFIALLLDGLLPPELIHEFKCKNVSLFPNFKTEINAECSCPDHAVPCKHIAALILYLSKVIDSNPYILLEIRGKSKGELLNDIRAQHSPDVESSSTIGKKQDKPNQTIEFEFNLPSIKIKDSMGTSPKDKPMELGFKFRKPKSHIEVLENLGLPNNLENPKAFSVIIDRVYRTTMSSVYKKSQKFD